MPSEPEGDATEKVGRIRGVSWTWREGNPAGEEGESMGVIAQEVEEVFPELVERHPDGHKMVNYAGLIGPLIEAIKELDARVAELEAQRGTEGEDTPASA